MHRMPLDIRRARHEDLPRLAALAGELVRMHHEADPARFYLPPDVEKGYAWWFGRELARSTGGGAVLLVAERDGAIVGYAYGAREERDWNMLLDAHGAIHDVFVEAPARGAGVGRRLVDAMVRELEALGAPRIVLSTMVGNDAAQRVFRACGFRPTMLEMTR
jgi:ribosomal protein S18 acetylase RimI-like enzyme